MDEKVIHIRVGGVDVAVWNNVVRDKPYKTVTIQRNYKINGVWKSAKNLRINDIPKAVLALQKAYEYIILTKGDR